MKAILLLDKPSGPSSNQVLQQVRRALGGVKIGHCGTLDPLASGMLLLLLAPATRLARYALHLDKTYELELELGLSTDSYDSTGTITSRRAWQGLSAEAVSQCLAEFVGEHSQRPPAYSAVKVGGKRAYRLARAGSAVELVERSVNLHSATIDAIDWPRVRARIHCSSGYYVRSLVHDWGERLGCGACLTQLRRTSIGDFQPEQMHSPERIADLLSDHPETQQRQATLQQLLLPVGELLTMPELTLDEQQSQFFCNGRVVNITDNSHPNATHQIYHAGQFLGLGQLQCSSLRPHLVLS